MSLAEHIVSIMRMGYVENAITALATILHLLSLSLREIRVVQEMLSSSIHCTLWRSCSYLRSSCKRIREASWSRYIVLARDVLQI